MKIYVVWTQERDFGPVRRRAFILANSFKSANRKAIKAGIYGIVDVWELYPNEIETIKEGQWKALNKHNVVKF